MGIASKLASNKLIKANMFKESEPEFISTGCLSLNVLFSGSLDGGIQKGKLSSIAADSAYGKSFLAMKVIRNAQKQGMDVLLMDTEFAYSPSFAKSLKINTEELVVVQNNHIEEVQHILVNAVSELTSDERKNLLIVLDSWGGMVTSKTFNDAQTGKDVTDMTVSKKKNSFARVLTGLGCTVFVVNQIYSSMDQYNPIAVSGGKGLYYACSSIVMSTSKAKSKDGEGDIDGAIVTAKAEKGRLCVEHSKLKYLIKHDGGISWAYGLLDIALEGGFIEKPTMGWYSRSMVENDRKWREREIWDNEKEFWEPVVNNPEFKLFIEKTYSYKHNVIKDHEEIDIDESEYA